MTEKIGETKKIGEVANTERNKERVTAMIIEFHNMCEKKGVIIPDDYRTEGIENIIVFYEKYLDTHKQKLVAFDYYKIISWYAVSIAQKMFNFFKDKNIQNDNWFKVIMLAIWRMIEELEECENRTISKNYMKKIIAMVACEIKNETDLGIGKNGLYMIMLIARIVQINTNSQTPHS